MRALVILARHGNTFEKGETPVMVGAYEDLPLTQYGEEQGLALGKALQESKVLPVRIISGPLKRTRVFAELIRAGANAQCLLEEDIRLIEFDYGAWSGLSNEEIIALSGESALLAWQERSERPAGVAFHPTAEEARADARDLLSTLSTLDGTTVIVTSNGRLREIGLFLAQTSGERGHAYKVKTGHSCVLLRDVTGWSVLGWDLSVAQLSELLPQVIRK